MKQVERLMKAAVARERDLSLRLREESRLKQVLDVIERNGDLTASHAKLLDVSDRSFTVETTSNNIQAVLNEERTQI